jgi:hypothetical protein
MSWSAAVSPVPVSSSKLSEDVVGLMKALAIDLAHIS